MHRTLAFGPLCAMLLLLVAPLRAGDDLRQEIQELREKVEALESQQSTLLGQEIEKYLAADPAWREAQGGDHDRITIHAAITGVNQNTVGLDPSNRSVVNGNYDLEFDFQVTDDLSMFLHMTGNGTDGAGLFGAHHVVYGPSGSWVAIYPR